MERLIYLPFENLPQRYCKMWNDSIIEAMSKKDIIVSTSQSENEAVIRQGEFLDICGTITHKQEQIKKVAELFGTGQIKNGDTFFVHDIFYPAIEAIRYMAELVGVKIRIVAFNHAGRADEDDFVQQLGAWSDSQEKAWHDLCDLILVGSQYHKERVERKFNCKNIAVTGAVWSSRWMDNFMNGYTTTKKDFVIFPHRPCREKRFNEFLLIAQQNQNLHFVITSSGNQRIDIGALPKNVEYLFNLSKFDYYKIFASADKYLSLAKQETFGYTLQEAIYFGCKVVVPDNACYREFADKNCVVGLEYLLEKDNLTNIYNTRNLRKSKNVEDNAKKIIELCTT